MSYSYLLKCILIGDQSVGKSCVLMQFIDKQFRLDSDPTIGVEFGSKTIFAHGKTIQLQIWDTAGQEAYKSITRSYYRGTIGAILVYDITLRNSFNNIVKWLEQIKDYSTNQQLSVIIVGNKTDLSTQRQVSTEEGETLAQTKGMAFIECSAKTGYNIDSVFQTLTEVIMNKIEKGSVDIYDESGGIKIGKHMILHLQQPSRRCC